MKGKQTEQEKSREKRNLAMDRIKQRAEKKAQRSENSLRTLKASYEKKEKEAIDKHDSNYANLRNLSGEKERFDRLMDNSDFENRLNCLCPNSPSEDVFSHGDKVLSDLLGIDVGRLKTVSAHYDSRKNHRKLLNYFDGVLNRELKENNYLEIKDEIDYMIDRGLKNINATDKRVESYQSSGRLGKMLRGIFLREYDRYVLDEINNEEGGSE
ncbi:hypothetical protein CMI47_03515 [Candidatus Pacearchaeota archaeon]|nr:hypothetical protein [Candidatus Pacearchaeota archaeon]|tara:strand:+ start:1024 stop:1659 length:636 start_codon:yes stop_codon:yes gene_type:complete